jgi:hypothetical protein
MRQLAKIAPPPLPNWSRRFDTPIFIQNRQQPIRSLNDAGQFIESLPKAEQASVQWQTAAKLLLMIAERGGDLMPARVAVMKALHRREPESWTTPRRESAKTYRTVR